MDVRERACAVVASVGFLIAEAALWWLHPPGHVYVVAACLSLAVAVLASRVRFETPLGFAVGSQLAFVPLVFALPPALVPLAACVTLLLAMLPDVVAGRLHPVRLVYVFRNCWYAIGPAWVIALAGDPHHLGAPLLLAALVSQFLIDFTTWLLATVVVHGPDARKQLNVASAYVVDTALACVGYVIAMQIRDSPFVVLSIVPLLGLLGVFGRERRVRVENLLELGETYRGTALLLGDVIEADDNYTGLHSQGVVELALAVGDELELDADQRRNLEFAALLHDIGKIAIPKRIINKPGRLDEEEWAIIRTHAAEGERMLARVGGFMTEVGRIVRSHHERWDGGGYPDGLRAGAAPMESRIITACDSWSAMRTNRPYRGALEYGEAVEEIVRNSGTQFDPQVASALLSVVAAERAAAASEDAPGTDPVLASVAS